MEVGTHCGSLPTPAHRATDTPLPARHRVAFLSCYLQSSVQIPQAAQKHEFKEYPQRCRKPQPWQQQFLLFSACSVTHSPPFPVTSLHLEIIHHFLKDTFSPHNKAAHVLFNTSQLSLTNLSDLPQHLQGKGLHIISCTSAHISFHHYPPLQEHQASFKANAGKNGTRQQCGSGRQSRMKGKESSKFLLRNVKGRSVKKNEKQW